MKVDPGGGCNTSWRVTVPDCLEPCKVFCHSDLDPMDVHPEAFFDPGIEACSRSVMLFDPIMHGYNAVLDRIEDRIEREAERELNGPKQYHRCPKCGNGTFNVEVGLEYKIGGVEVFADNHDFPWSDMFDTFYISGTCTSCSHKCLIGLYAGL
jgi:hypothetical protein